jgi:hypothetical protein
MTMNTEELRKNEGSQVKLRPPAASVTATGRRVSADDFWTIRHIERGSVELENQRTGHVATVANDNIQEFRSPNFLALRCQLTLTDSGVLSEPLFAPLTPRGGPAATPLTQEEHDLLIRSRGRGDLYVVSTEQTGEFVRVEGVDYVDPDPAVASRYRDALDSLCQRVLVRHERSALYRVTAEGFNVARRLQPRLKVELVEPVNPPGHRGPPYTPAWNVELRLTATAGRLSVVDVRLEEEGVGEWLPEELSCGGVALRLPLDVTGAVQFWFRARSPRTFEGGPVRLGKLTLQVRDHLQPACDSHDLQYGR